MAIPTGDELLSAVHSLAPRVRAGADAAEANRRLDPALVADMARAGLFRMMLPRDLGGSELDPLTGFAIVKEFARIDGSAGWVLMIGAGTAAYVVPFLRADVACEVFVRDPDAIIGGPFAMLGRATPVPGGYRVQGRWPFASGCEHSQWLIGGCVVADSDPRQTRTVLLPAAECEIHNTWSVSGLRATGSHDIQVSDLFVPDERALSMDAAGRVRHEPLYAVKFFLAFHAAQALGVARHALDAFAEYAAATPAGPGALVRDRPLAQMRMAQAEALVGAARAYILAAVEDAWRSAVIGDGVSREQGLHIRLAMTAAVQHAAEAVGLLYDAAGGAAIYERNPFERCWRDIRTATQHAAVASPTWEWAGRNLLGAATDAWPL